MDAPDSTESRANTLRAMMPTGGHVLALLVLLGTLVLVFVAWRYARDREVRSAEVEFVATTVEVCIGSENFIQRFIARYWLVLIGLGTL